MPTLAAEDEENFAETIALHGSAAANIERHVAGGFIHGRFGPRLGIKNRCSAPRRATPHDAPMAAAPADRYACSAEWSTTTPAGMQYELMKQLIETFGESLTSDALRDRKLASTELSWSTDDEGKITMTLFGNFAPVSA